MLTVREKFILQFLLRKLNEYSAVVRGEEVAVPKKYMLEMQKARVRNLSDEEKKDLISEIKNEMMLSESFLVTTATNDVVHSGDEKLI